jgi:hypothetical protein
MGGVVRVFHSLSNELYFFVINYALLISQLL